MTKQVWGKLKRVRSLFDARGDYLDREVPMMREPVQPVCVANAVHIAIKDNSLAFRNYILFPWLLILCCGCFIFADRFYAGWVKSEQLMISDIEEKKIKYGGKYFLETENINDMKIYYSINAAGDLPLWQYLNLRYQSYELPYRSEYIKPLYLELIAVSVFVIGLPLLLISIIKFKRLAPLYFDRDRRLVYTWRFGSAWVQKYENLEFSSNSHALKFCLYSLKSDSTLKKCVFKVQPSGSLLINGEVHYRPLLAAICQFMEKGRGRVWWEDWSESKGGFIYDDEMPNNLYEQIEQLQKKLT